MHLNDDISGNNIEGTSGHSRGDLRWQHAVSNHLKRLWEKYLKNLQDFSKKPMCIVLKMLVEIINYDVSGKKCRINWFQQALHVMAWIYLAVPACPTNWLIIICGDNRRKNVFAITLNHQTTVWHALKESFTKPTQRYSLWIASSVNIYQANSALLALSCIQRQLNIIGEQNQLWTIINFNAEKNDIS